MWGDNHGESGTGLLGWESPARRYLENDGVVAAEHAASPTQQARGGDQAGRRKGAEGGYVADSSIPNSSSSPSLSGLANVPGSQDETKETGWLSGSNGSRGDDDDKALTKTRSSSGGFGFNNDSDSSVSQHSGASRISQSGVGKRHGSRGTIGWLPPRLAALASRRAALDAKHEQQEREQRQNRNLLVQHLQTRHTRRNKGGAAAVAPSSSAFFAEPSANSWEETPSKTRGRGLSSTFHRETLGSYVRALAMAAMTVIASVVLMQILFKGMVATSTLLVSLNVRATVEAQSESFAGVDESMDTLAGGGNSPEMLRLKAASLLSNMETSVGVISRLDEASETSEEREQRLRDSLEENLSLKSRPWLEKKCTTLQPIEKIPTVIVVSNRRSGTHLTMDTLWNIYEGDFNMLKANHIMAIDGNLHCDCRRWLRANAKLVHPHRSVLDVVVSMFHYRRFYDSTFRKSMTWKKYLQSSYLDKVLDQWSQTVHSWFVLDDVYNVEFSELINLDRAALAQVAAHIGMNMTRQEDRLDQRNWEFVSRAVQKKKGKAAGGGFKTKLEPEEAEAILAKVRANPVWSKDRMLTCEGPEPFVHDQICVDRKGALSLVRNEKSCVILGTTVGRPAKNGGQAQSYICMPKSCPKDLIEGLMITRYKGKTYQNRHRPGFMKGSRS